MPHNENDRPARPMEKLRESSGSFHETPLFTEEQSTIYRKPEEYDIDFNNMNSFAITRWGDASQYVKGQISDSDRMAAAKFSDWQTVTAEIQGKLTDPLSTRPVKREMSRIHQLPRNFEALFREFSKRVNQEVSSGVLWQLLYLNLKYSYTSPDRLKRTSDVLSSMRGSVARFNTVIQIVDDSNEAIIATTDFLDPVLLILSDLFSYLHDNTSDSEADKAWPKAIEKINDQAWIMNEVVKHVSEMNSYTKVNQELNIKNMSLRHALIPEMEETAAFPIRSLQNQPNTTFFGRHEELEKIERYLAPQSGTNSLRSYTLYGRRGVGKTEIAIQFAYKNRCDFDAIFWVRCETSVSIRESFTGMAIKLDLPGADREGRHEENLLGVQNWLRKTKKNWLLIFDNAEKDTVLQRYWPVGANGALLITSRKYYNFAKDLTRQGDTIKPFDAKSSWNLLFHLLGDQWQKDERDGTLPRSEQIAAKNMLEKIEGLALAIQHAANAIKSPDIGGPTIVGVYELLREKIRTLPERHSKPRSSSERALDALWDMTFNSLHRNARALVGVLSWLSPDSILIDLFSPQNQDALSGPMAFCRQDSLLADTKNRINLVSTITPSEGFRRAAEELKAKNLIKWEGRYLAIHRMVQEAVNFHDISALQESLDIASRLAWEQFPKQDSVDDSLYKRWATCARYIHHGVYLSRKVAFDYPRNDGVKGSEYFVKLLGNCAWYLCEVGDYDVSKKLIDTAMIACKDKTTLQFAQLLDISGSALFDLNRLRECQREWQSVLRLRQQLLPHDHPQIGAINNNLGNLETAFGNFDDAEDYFERASLIWSSKGDDTAYQLALTYLCVGRMNISRGDLEKADESLARAETLFLKILGGDQGMMSHVHYCQGKVHFLRGQYPIHPLTSTAYYAMACLEFAEGHITASKSYLDKSKEIAELRSPTRDDGLLARILYKRSQVLQSDTYGTYADEAALLRSRAVSAREALSSLGEGGAIPADDKEDFDEEEAAFDAMISLFYR